MSETTPVHTGTDRVELTKDERDQMQVAIMADEETWHVLVAAVESIVAARVQALTAERDFERSRCASLAKTADAYMAERDAARAELAAANASAAEKAVLAREWADKAFGERAERDRLQAEIERLRELMTPAQKELDGIGITWQSRAKRMAARVAALQETLDRVTALADEWEAEAAKATRPVRKMGAGSRADKFIQGHATNLARQAKRLRAALTPEGSE